MRRKAFASFRHGKTPVATIIVAALLMASALVLVSTMRSGIVEASSDTFGYETIGGSSENVTNRITGSSYQILEVGNADNIIAYFGVGQEGGDVKAAIYDHDNGDLMAEGHREFMDEYPAAWQKFQLTTNPPLVQNNYYVLVTWSNADVSCNLFYDSGGAIVGHYKSEAYGSFPSSITWDDHEGRQYSIYVEYIEYAPPPIYPTQPVLYLPENNENFGVTNTPYFEWTNGENADNHRIEVDNDSDFSSCVDNVTITGDNFWTKTGDGYSNDNYHWRVTAVNENGENTSGARVFQVDIISGWITPPSVENYCGENTGSEATKTIDENNNSYWQHITTENHWIIFDMGMEREITKVRLYQSASPFGATEGLLVYVSDNTIDWGDNVWEGNLGVVGWNETGSFDENARYIKLQSKDNYNLQTLYEFQAYIGRFVDSVTLYLPENDWTINDNTPYFEWVLDGQFAENYRLLIDNDSNFLTPVENTLFDNTENSYTAVSEYPWENYYWKVITSRDNEVMESSSAVWEFELIFANPSIQTNDATNVLTENATFNSYVHFGSYDNIDVRYKYKGDEQNYVEGENENWSLSDWYYESSTPPDNAGNWGIRTPINYVAASDSSPWTTANYTCDGTDDQAEIQSAMDNLNGYGGGTVYLFAGTYYFGNVKFTFRHNISMIGEGRENVILYITSDSSRFAQGPTGAIVYAENLLFENFTVEGPGRLIEGETNGIQVSNIAHVVFRNLRVENLTAEGIYLEQGTEYIMFDIWVINCIVRNTGEHGIVIDGNNPNIRDIYVLNNTLTGVGLGSPSYNRGSGIAIYEGNRIVVANNTVENSGSYGVRVTGAENKQYENILIQGNIFRRNARRNLENDAGVLAGKTENLENIIIRGNDIDQFKGIRLTNVNFKNSIIDNNNLYNTVFAIWDNQGAGNVIENNVDSNFSDNNYTSWETIQKVVNYGWQDNSKVVENLYPVSIHGYKTFIRYDTTENENTAENWRIFTTSGIGQPVLYYPENDNVLTASPIFEWTNGSGASYHTLLVDNDYDFSSTVIDINISIPENTFVSALSDDNYWWKVIAVYGTDENSSDNWTFELLLAPPFEGSGTVEDPYLIPNVGLLQAMDNYKTSHFALQNDIDASATLGWNGGAGFMPVGDNINKFTGSLDGRGYIISDLFINRDNENLVGIFGGIGNNSMLENIGVENENITGNNYVGGLAGYSEGIVSQCYSAGSVVGDNYVGGLVGFNTENVINTYSTSSVTGNFDVGGLVGHNDGLVSNSYSIGFVIGNYNVGGIVGYEIGYAWAWYEVETWTNYMGATGTGWYEVETWTNYMDATGTGWYEVETWTNYMYAGPMWQTVETWTNYIDAPTETTFYSMDDDGYITNQAASYVAVHDNTVGYALGDSSDRLYIGQVYILEYEIKRSFVYFDTSSIPDTATIQSATLSLYGRTDSSDADFDIVIQNGQPTYPRDPLVLGDYYYAHYGTTDGGSFNTSGFTTSGYNDITLNEDGLTWINKTGTTKLALRSDNDIYSITPTEYEYVSVYSFEKGVGYQPKLTVSYTTGTVSNSFYDNQTSGQSDTGKGLGLPTAQMQQISTFLDNGWDIVLRENYVDEIWYIDNGTDYPRLGWEAIMLAWYEVETWTNYMNASPVGWYEVETWTNYVHVLNWYEVETWTNYAKRSTWYEVETWTNYMNVYVTGWWEVETWTNYVDTVPPEWYEVETWTNYLNVSPPGWYEVETWTNYMNVYPPGWWEVETWTNNIDASEEEIPVPPAEQPSVWVTIIRILGIIGFLGWAGWRFKLVDDPATGIEAGLTVVVAIIGIVIIWFVAEAIGEVAAAL